MVERIGTCRVLGEIGSGGMAVVYEAIQEPLNRRVAIKALKPSIAIDSQFAERFEREAHFMASLQHENILHVIDFVKDGRSMFIIMEYVDGIDLYDLLERSPRLPADIAAIIALQLARHLASERDKASRCNSRAAWTTHTSAGSFTATSSLRTSWCRCRAT